MIRKSIESKDVLLNRLYEEMRNRLEVTEADELIAFASNYYATLSQSDLAEWRLQDLYGSTLACWLFIQQYKGGGKVRVFNPDYEQHGWQSTHTVVEVLYEDMPFIVDSLRMELNRRNLAIHAIHNAVLTVKRDDEHQFKGLLANGSRAKAARRESLVFIEVDRHTDPFMLDDLQDTLSSVLSEVNSVVDDFVPLMEKAEILQAEYSGKVPGQTAADVKEVHEFISWLENHFTFLGYDEFEAIEENGNLTFKAVPGSQLGLLRECDDSCPISLLQDIRRDSAHLTGTEELLVFSKSSTKARVHRPAYPDYITVKRFDKKGKLVGACRFQGLYTSQVYIQSSRTIPLIRRKLDEVLERSGLVRYGHDWKELQQILEIYPRDDLFQVSVEELYQTSMGILHIHERRQIRLFVSRDKFGQFFSCLVYAPRDVYSTEFRRRVETLLLEALDCDSAEFTTYFSESVLARTQFILHSSKGCVKADFDVELLEQQVRQAARSWGDDLYDALIENMGEERGIHLFNHYGGGFSPSYRADFQARTAVVDIQYMEQLGPKNELQMSFYRALEKDASVLCFKLFSFEKPLPLSDVLPVLENLGLRVIDEHPYEVFTDSRRVWIHDFNLKYTGAGTIDMSDIADIFQDAFINIWRGRAASDDFNRLVIGARLGWREVAMLRAMAAYMKQIRFNYGVEAITSTLNHHVDLSRKLVELFRARFDPDSASTVLAEEVEKQLLDGLDQVSSLNEDQVIRQYLALIKATLRTNFYQLDSSGGHKPYYSYKFSPRDIPDMPEPRPMFEIFVFSPRMEGVHLRGGRVARGGLRWSDRMEDFRTEVLGLVKAQQVKNAVIVPVGAKGGFVAKKLHDGMSRDEWLAEGVNCYRMFISGLLDVTDNLVEGDVIPPERIVRHDEDDTYLVVAADKGTATFSDIANGIAEDYGFWLGDAFASGGSQGYDHKKMGITAKGAWVSVERHFREMGLNTAKDEFTVLGIGDMSGDVFGNGMLLSDKIRLQAAFNHLHIFVDPEPNAADSFKERKRLFELPRSGWTDYNADLISKGGGIFERTAKAIKLTPQMKKLTGLSKASVTPNELIKALLKSSVDLIWNGGIGTYVKASDETDADIGDKANDALRVNGNELNCRVIGEGGNLGFSQKARMEAALNGVRVNTDFIDNAGGVDCSDHEVNIKILLNDIVMNGDMTAKQRNQLLADMTDTVSDLVLKNNYRQVQSISLVEARALVSMAENRRFISNLESQGKLDRALEFLPDDEQLVERRGAGQGLSRPELSVLISYSKAELKEALAASEVPDDPYLARELETAFPTNLVADYGSVLEHHRLHREIVATQIANHMVNFMGISFAERLVASTGADIAAVARSYILARDVFDIENLWSQVEALDYKVDSDTQIEMMHNLQHLVRRASRWFVRNRRSEVDCVEQTEMFTGLIAKVARKLDEILCGAPKEQWDQEYQRLVDAAVPAKLAKVIAGSRSLYATLGVIEVSNESSVNVETVARAYFDVGQLLNLHWFAEQLNKLEVDSHWQALAREAFRDDLDWQQRSIVSTVLKHHKKGKSIDDVVDQWAIDNKPLVDRWHGVLNELKSAEKQDYAMYTVAVRELFDLAKNSAFADH